MKTAAPSSATIEFDPAQMLHDHQAGVWRYLRALGCSPSEANDFTQETFLAVFQRPLRVSNHASCGAYLRRVAYNLYVTTQRRASRVVGVENVEEFDAAWNRWMGDDDGEGLLELLRHCLGALSDQARRALEMQYRDHMRRCDIACSLNITEQGAGNLMQRAKMQLRSCIDRKRQ
jgi:RNA polymerase sigma-70 factor (ECF subfamily)